MTSFYGAKSGQAERPNCPNCRKPLLASKFPGLSWWCGNKKSCGFKGIRSGYQKREIVVGQIEPMATPSTEQKDIFDTVAKKDCHIYIAARAGTGKTTVQVQNIRILKERGKSVLALVFSRRDKMALEDRCRGNAKVWTNNGAGLSILSAYARSMGKRFELKMDYARDILQEMFVEDGLVQKDENGRLGEWEKGAAGMFRNTLALVSKARTTLRLRKNPTPGTKEKPDNNDWTELGLRFGIEVNPETLERVFHYCSVLFTKLSDLNLMLKRGGMDHDGCVFLPSYHDLLPAEQFDYIIVDECQDQSYVNRRLVELFLKPTGHIIAVGDEFQAIYGWRGADSDSMGEMLSLMQSTGRPVVQKKLTLCRRCPKVVIGSAQKLVEDIQALPDAPEGEEGSTGNDEEMIQELRTNRKGLVLCRANAPLISMCLSLIQNGVPAVMSKNKIIEELFTLMDNLSEYNPEMNVTEFLNLLEAWKQDKVSKLATRQGTEGQIQIVEDKVACLHALAADVKVQTVGGIQQKLRSLFPNEDYTPNPNNMVVLSTVHGAKGGEAHSVYLYSPTDSKKGSLWDAVWSDAKDRDNVLYVAITRCEFRIVFVGAPPTLVRFADDQNKEIVQAVLESAPVNPDKKPVVKKATKKPAAKKVAAKKPAAKKVTKK